MSRRDSQVYDLDDDCVLLSVLIKQYPVCELTDPSYVKIHPKRSYVSAFQYKFIGIGSNVAIICNYQNLLRLKLGTKKNILELLSFLEFTL